MCGGVFDEDIRTFLRVVSLMMGIGLVIEGVTLAILQTEGE